MAGETLLKIMLVFMLIVMIGMFIIIGYFTIDSSLKNLKAHKQCESQGFDDYEFVGTTHYNCCNEQVVSNGKYSEKEYCVKGGKF